MKVARYTFVALWIGWHLAFWLGTTYTDYSNQINWLFAFGLLAFGCLVVPASSPLALLLYEHASKVRGLLTLWGLIALYLIAFYAVSLWELFPGTTVVWGKFELVHFAVAAVFYMLGRAFDERSILVALHVLGVVIVAATVIQLGLDHEENRRYGYGWQLMLCLPASVLLRKYWFVAAAFLVMLASRHKAALACAALSVGITFVFASLPKERVTSIAYLTRASAAVVAVLGSVLLLLVYPDKATEAFAPAIERFLDEDAGLEVFGVEIRGEGPDPARELVTARSVELLRESLPQGMGYMNFATLIGDETGALSTLVGGREFYGINLHNSYMTWVLEGGVLVSCVVLLLFWRTWARISWLRRNPATYNFGILFIAWAAACLLLAGFHQLHAIMQFWGTLGLIYGYYDHHALVTRARSVPLARSSTPPDSF